VDGKLTKVRPQHDLVVAFITVRHASAGQLAVRITSGNHLEWLHDVDIEDPADEQILAYDATAGIWKNIDIPESAAVISSATAPANTTAIWFNTENGNTYIYYDDFWTSIAGSSGAPIISDTAPADPVLGTQWFNSSTGKSYLYFSNAWIEIDSNGATPSSGNVIINGAFDIWQRGTSFNVTSAALTFSADRFYLYNNGNGSMTASRQTFTPGAAPVAGYEGQFFHRLSIGSLGTSTGWILHQRIEDVRTFAGQATTFSFWARSSNTQTLGVGWEQNFGSGGSTLVTGELVESINLTSSWTRYSYTVTLPSISGKTIGTNPYLIFSFGIGSSIKTGDFDIWGVQVEAGAVATPFRRNAPSIQAELAACQRYYLQSTALSGGQSKGFWFYGWNPDNAFGKVVFPVEMRISPTITIYNEGGGSGGANRVGVGDVTGVAAQWIDRQGFSGIFKAGGLVAGSMYVGWFKAESEL
jgi:hypothetical protein